MSEKPLRAGEKIEVETLDLATRQFVWLLATVESADADAIVGVFANGQRVTLKSGHGYRRPIDHETGGKGEDIRTRQGQGGSEYVNRDDDLGRAKYELRIVAFLDVLGWKAIIKNTANDSEYLSFVAQTLDKATSFLKRRTVDDDGSPSTDRFTHFSDSMVISFISDDDYHIYRLFREVEIAIRTLFLSGILVRGGISIGRLIHTEKHVFGPALNSAYEAESSFAVYPRVILDEEAASYVKSSVKLNAFNERSGLLSTDDDGRLFIDYFRSWRLQQSPWELMYREPRLYLSPYRAQIIYWLIQSRGDQKVFPKYEWLASYLNRCLADFPHTECDPIAIEHLAVMYRCSDFDPVEFLSPAVCGKAVEQQAADHAAANPGALRIEDMRRNIIWQRQ